LPEALDAECEGIVRGFLHDGYGRVEYPIRTDDLTVLLERDAQRILTYMPISRRRKGRSRV